MERIEYWAPTGEFTGSGDTRFVKATIERQHGRNNLRVTLNEDNEITHVELLKEM